MTRHPHTARRARLTWYFTGLAQTWGQGRLSGATGSRPVFCGVLPLGRFRRSAEGRRGVVSLSITLQAQGSPSESSLAHF